MPLYAAIRFSKVRKKLYVIRNSIRSSDFFASAKTVVRMEGELRSERYLGCVMLALTPKVPTLPSIVINRFNISLKANNGPSVSRVQETEGTLARLVSVFILLTTGVKN